MSLLTPLVCLFIHPFIQSSIEHISSFIPFSSPHFLTLSLSHKTSQKRKPKKKKQKTNENIKKISVMSIPIFLLRTIQIPLRAKLSIGAALSLSLFMMVIAIVRVSFASLGPEMPDTAWIYFCFSLEASTAVFMVSATAFRSAFGSRDRNRNKTRTRTRTRTGEVKIKASYSSMDTAQTTNTTKEAKKALLGTSIALSTRYGIEGITTGSSTSDISNTTTITRT
jgi:hypothetical protein